MTTFGIYDEPTARIVWETVRYLRANGFVVPGARPAVATMPVEAPIYVRNDSGEEIPPFACMRVTGTVEAGGQNYIKVEKPNTSAALYLFNSQAPIEVPESGSAYGIAQNSHVMRMATDGSTPTVNASWRPVNAQWYVEPGSGPFAAIGADDIETDVMRGMLRQAIIDLRLSGNNLQYTTDGINWTTWTTATTC